MRWVIVPSAILGALVGSISEYPCHGSIGTSICHLTILVPVGIGSSFLRVRGAISEGSVVINSSAYEGGLGEALPLGAPRKLVVINSSAYEGLEFVFPN